MSYFSYANLEKLIVSSQQKVSISFFVQINDTISFLFLKCIELIYSKMSIISYIFQNEINNYLNVNVVIVHISIRCSIDTSRMARLVKSSHNCTASCPDDATTRQGGKRNKHT
jgi:hypothetical protein